ncbi:hypothetical protein M2282_003582 [Variovorax boronicumulans]|uniref:T6SS effector BTH_I2691 family protein n=1 Tax=Variovorax boronicumulans TaxID=436515 RepID=UPI002476B319|nr:T6SS effector BTH_I2691 family protein [Variovorax boronicumulans]MDH6168429.1 hypothetical protein [Variovorax boronicumulans]
MAKENCKKCEKSGLSILLVRPSAISDVQEIAPPNAHRLATYRNEVHRNALELPSLKRARYVFRLLREGGYVYVYYPGAKPKKLLKPWEVYKVHAQGALLPEGEFSHSSSDFACSRQSTHPHDVRTICIEEPNIVGKVWIGFSMNFWSDAIKARMAQSADARTQAGMVEVNLALAKQPSGFKAEAGDIQRYVADYALSELTHAGVESATPFYPAPMCKPGEDETTAAKSLAAVMKKQAESSSDTAGREQVLAIPDPVGLSADLNGIRLATDRWAKQQLLVPRVAWPLASHVALEALHQQVLAAGAIEAQEKAWSTTSQAEWDRMKNSMPYAKRGDFVWQPLPDGSLAPDGSPAGRMRGGDTPLGRHRNQETEDSGKKLGAKNWQSIADQIDESKRAQWWDQHRSNEKTREAYVRDAEEDWLEITCKARTLDYFEQHFDENEPNKPTAPVCPGLIYAQESGLIHQPQPLVFEKHGERYMQNVIEPGLKDLADPRAPALRAMYGNQKSVIASAKALLLGTWDRSDDPQSEQGDVRDKTIDLLRGLLTHDLGRRFGWLHPRLMALAAGQTAAFIAGALQMAAMAMGKPTAPPSASMRRYLATAPLLTVAQRQLELAVEASRPGGDKAALSVAVLLKVDLDSADVARVMKSYMPEVNTSRMVPVVVQRGHLATLVAVTDVATAQKVHEGKLKAVDVKGGRVVVAPTGGPAPQSLEEVIARARGQGIKGTQTAAEVVAVLERQAIKKELGFNSIDGRLAISAMGVQALGLYQGIPKLLAELDKADRDQGKLNEAVMGVADSTSGLLGAAAEVWASQHKAALLMKEGGEHLAVVSTKLAVLRTFAAATGVAGSVFAVIFMAKKAGDAGKAGDAEAMLGYRYSQFSFVVTGATGTVATVDALAKGAATRGVARFVLTRVAGAVAAEAAVAAGAGAVVASAITGVGLILLLVGLAAYVYAEVSKRNEYQRWAGRSYFGKDKSDPQLKDDGVNKEARFRNLKEEQNWLAALYYETENASEIAESNKREQRGKEAPRRSDGKDKTYRPRGNFGIYG